MKKYFTKHSKKDSKSYLDFHLLIYLAKIIDVDTIIGTIEAIMNGEPIPEGTLAIMEELY